MMTVLPTPAPPKTPILPPFAKGQMRSMTLMPVSKTSVAVACSSNAGGVAVDRIAHLRRDRALLVDRLAEHVEDPTERLGPDRHADRAPEVDGLGAAREAVGRAHRDRAHPVVAEVLLDLARDAGRRAARRARR